MSSEPAGDDHTPFREVQRIKQWWVWLFLIAAAGSAWYLALQQLFGKKNAGANQSPDWAVWLIWLLIGLGLPLLLLSAALVVEVRRDGIYYRYYPFHRRFHHISYDSIEKAEARTYQPIREYGGWGIRASWNGKGKAYNVYGNRGMQIELKNGRGILFGSQKAEELAAAVNREMEREMRGGH